MSEIELILTKLKIVSEEKESGVYLCDKEHSKILLDYIQQKENIIKEVRKYIRERTEFGEYTYAYPGVLNQDEVREINRILDKGE